MPACEHKYKKRIYGPFSQDSIGEKLICGDCLTTLSVTDRKDMPKNTKQKVTIDDSNRLGLSELVTGLLKVNCLSDWEQGFFDQLMDRYGKYGERTMISEKQQTVLDRMQAKYLADYKPEPPTTEALMKEASRNAPPMTNDGFMPGEDDIPF